MGMLIRLPSMAMVFISVSAAAVAVAPVFSMIGRTEGVASVILSVAANIRVTSHHARAAATETTVIHLDTPAIFLKNVDKCA